MKVQGWVMMSPAPKDPDNYYQTVSGRIYDTAGEAISDCRVEYDSGRMFPVQIEYEQLDKTYRYDKKYNFIVENTNES